MKFVKSTLLSIIVFASFMLTAEEQCEVSEEWIQSYRDAVETIKGPYLSCTQSARDHVYWKAMAQCMSLEAERIHLFGCDYMVTHGIIEEDEAETEHCSVFKWKQGDVQRLRNEIVDSKGIKRCMGN